MWVDSTQTLIFDTKDELDMKYYFTNRDRLLSEGWKEECFSTTGIIFVKHGLPAKFDLKENTPYDRYEIGYNACLNEIIGKDCRECVHWETCVNGKEGHEKGTSQGYSIGECQYFEKVESSNESNTCD